MESIYTKLYDTYADDTGKQIQVTTSLYSTFFTFAATFIATFLSFSTLHIIFGYGGGQLAE